MSARYGGIAGQSLGRLAALSGGLFAVAMTLLVLDVRVPAGEAVRRAQPLWESGAVGSERGLWEALLGLAPSLLTYFMSFLTLGIFWVAQQTQLNHFARSAALGAGNMAGFMVGYSAAGKGRSGARW